MSKRFFFAAAWTLLLLTACLIPGRWLRMETTAVPTGIPHVDKLVHFGLFACFGLLWMFGDRRRTRMAWLVAIGLLLAVGTEWAQGLEFIARDPDPLDALADAIGLIAGVATACVMASERSPE